jgi:hypothetical protein
MEPAAAAECNRAVKGLDTAWVGGVEAAGEPNT